MRRAYLAITPFVFIFRDANTLVNESNTPFKTLQQEDSSAPPPATSSSSYVTYEQACRLATSGVNQPRGQRNEHPTTPPTERNRIVFLIVRWGGWNLWHNLFDHGLLQVWMAWKMLVEKIALSTFDGPNTVEPRAGINIMHNLFGPPEARPALFSLWQALLEPQFFSIDQRTAGCDRFNVLGDLPVTPSGRHKMRHDILSPTLLSYLRNFSSEMTTNLVAKYGDARVNKKAPVVMEDRPYENTFVDGTRSRGVQPYLRAELLEMIKNYTGAQHVVRKFTDSTPFSVQFHWIRSARYIIAAEGAFMAFMHLSAPNTTWICVNNHTQRPYEWAHTNWHAPAAAYNWMRVIFYMIDNGVRAPMTDFAELMEGPFKPGVYYIGSDETGHRPKPK